MLRAGARFRDPSDEIASAPARARNAARGTRLAFRPPKVQSTRRAAPLPPRPSVTRSSPTSQRCGPPALAWAYQRPRERQPMDRPPSKRELLSIEVEAEGM